MESILKKIILFLSVYLVLALLPIEHTWSNSRSFTAIDIDHYDIIFIIVLFKLFKIVIDELNNQTR